MNLLRYCSFNWWYVEVFLEMDIRIVHSPADASLVYSRFVYFPDRFLVLQKIWPWKAEWVLLGKGTALLLSCFWHVGIGRLTCICVPPTSTTEQRNHIMAKLTCQKMVYWKLLMPEMGFFGTQN